MAVAAGIASSRGRVENELSALRQRWLASGSLSDEQAYLAALVHLGHARFVVLDPDGTLPPWLGVLIRRETGVVYAVQCAGVATEERLIEGYFVPSGGWKHDPDAGAIEPGALNEVFHDGDACKWGYQSPQLPAERLVMLNALVEQIPFWHGRFVGQDHKRPLRLDSARIHEIAEAWIPVQTPDGPGVLVYKNCD